MTRIRYGASSNAADFTSPTTPGLGRTVVRLAGQGLDARLTVASNDQVLACGVNHAFLPVRLAAVAGKHLVMDEVHTLDAYQHVLLTRVIGWLGLLGSRVTLLSATLPQARLRD